MSLMKWIEYELDYKQYHEPFFGNGDGMDDETINSKLLVDDKIVVKDFPFRIRERNYNLNDVISKFDKIIIHKRNNLKEVSISLHYHQSYSGESKMHEVYQLDDEWLKNNEIDVLSTMESIKHMYDDLNQLDIECLHTTYDGIYNDKTDVPKLMDYLNIYEPRYLDFLNENRRLRNGDIGMNNIKVKPKFI